MSKNQKDIKISIITVTLNNLEGFNITAKSIIRQTANSNNWEWIIIDGGSIDGTVEAIQCLNSKIAYWISEPDGSIYEAMNKGIMQANGEYILFLNAGDTFYSSNVISEIINDKKFNTADYLSGNLFYTKKMKIIGKEYAPKVITGKFLFCKTLCHQSTLIRRSRLCTLKGYDTTYKITADAKFFFQDIIMNNASYERLNIYIVNYDTTGISSTNWATTKIERQRYLQELLPQRIYEDYYRLQYGETLLEKILCKIKPNTTYYKLLTYIAVLLYLPISLKHRIYMLYNNTFNKKSN